MMGSLPSPSQVARSHTALYEALYRQVDPGETDRVSGVDAAAFLRRSGLHNRILGKIWTMSDPQRTGFLNKQGFYVALKLIALHQNGKDLTLANMNLDLPPPQLQTASDRNSPAVDWNIKPVEQKKYEELFYSMGPIAGKLPGAKVKGVMLKSKLSRNILGKIWELSDTDQDGYLSKEEFVLAMHLVYKAQENIPVPSVLPPELISILESYWPQHPVRNYILPVPPQLQPAIPAQQPPQPLQRPPSYRRSKALVIINPDTGTDIFANESGESGNSLAAASRNETPHLQFLGDSTILSESSRPSSPDVQDNFDDVYNQTTSNHRTVHVCGLAKRTEEQQIRSIFGAYGEIEDVKLFTRHSDKFGFIRFSTKVSATLAICACDGILINGTTVRCKWSDRPDDNLAPGAVEAPVSSTPAASTPRPQTEPITFPGLPVASSGLVMPTPVPTQTVSTALPTSASYGLGTEVLCTSASGNNGIRGATTTKEEKIDLVCKICMDTAVAVVFLPCGHITSCQECSTKISQCPMCRERITQKVRTYFS